MGQGIPVDTIAGAVMQGEAEVEVEVQHVHPKRVGQSAAVKVGLNDIVAELGSLVFNLRSGKQKEQHWGSRRVLERTNPSSILWKNKNTENNAD